MTTLANILMLFGGLIAILAGVGVLKFSSSYARFHAASKASPVAFLVASIGAAIQLGAAGSAYLAIASAAMILTLPVGVHLLFRAVHRTSTNDHLMVDDLAVAEFNQALDN
ncbi:MAG: multicomponent Na+:H+ antiporter subunit G [Candidatus Aldehydirespiratoraceae bacterium]|jgi:multicomponent Na+:H+ antiporter subunit G